MTSRESVLVPELIKMAVSPVPTERQTLVPPSDPSDARPEAAHGANKYAWPAAVAIITGEIVGTGVMGLPRAMAELGWVYGITVCLVGSIASYFTGSLLAQIRNELYPQGSSYADLASEFGGEGWHKFTDLAIKMNWFLLMPYYVVAATDGLVIAFYDGQLCNYSGPRARHALAFSKIYIAERATLKWRLRAPGGLIICLLLLPLAQIPSLHGLRVLAAASNAAMLLAMIRELRPRPRRLSALSILHYKSIFGAALLCGRAGRLPAENGGFLRGQ